MNNELENKIDWDWLSPLWDESIPMEMKKDAIRTMYRTAYTAGLERGLELVPEKNMTYRDKLEHWFSEGFNSCRSLASSAINEEINKSKV